MASLYKTELKKLFFKKSTSLLFLIIIMFSFIYVFIPVTVLDSENKTYTDNWRLEVKKEINKMSEQNEIITQEHGADLPRIEGFAFNDNLSQIDRLSFYLDNNIKPPPQLNIMENLIGLPILDIILAIMSIVIAGKIIPKEVKEGTINLLLIRPYTRNEVLLSKYLVSVSLILFLLLTLYIFTALFSIIFGEINSTTDLVLSSVEGLVQINFWNYLIGSMCSSLFFLILVTTMAFCIGTITFSSTITLGSLMLLLVGEIPILNYLSNDTELTKYLLITNWKLHDFLPGNSTYADDMSLGISIAICLSYLIVFHLLSIYIFNKRDIS